MLILARVRLPSCNANHDFLQATSNFLNCVICKIHFFYLGIPRVTNPHRCATWVPVLLKLRNKFSIWKGKKVSLGGRVTFINAVMNSLHVFYISFFKSPKRVLKEIVGIQYDFIWGGLDSKKKHISLVSWSSNYKHKVQGGLRIKFCELLNLAFLRKWAWKILFDYCALWLPLLHFRYNDIKALVLDHSWPVKFTKQSLWQRDLRLATGNADANVNVKKNKKTS